MASLLRMVWLYVGLASALNLPARDYSTGEKPLDKCPGYRACTVKTTPTGLTANLVLAGPACNVYGDDLKKLKLEVNYDTGRIVINYLESGIPLIPVPRVSTPC